MLLLCAAESRQRSSALTFPLVCVLLLQASAQASATLTLPLYLQHHCHQHTPIYKPLIDSQLAAFKDDFSIARLLLNFTSLQYPMEWGLFSGALNAHFKGGAHLHRISLVSALRQSSAQIKVGFLVGPGDQRSLHFRRHSWGILLTSHRAAEAWNKLGIRGKRTVPV